MTAPPASDLREGRFITLVLSFAGGYVDTFSFVALFGLFTAHVTGNFVLIGSALAGQGHAGVLGKLLALPAFVIGVGATRWFQRRRERDERGEAISLVRAQLVGLLVFLVAGVAAGPFTDGDSLATVCVGLAGVLAMSVQNTAARSIFAHLSSTTVMTGNVTQLTMDLIDLIDVRSDRSVIKSQVAKLWRPIVAFMIGAVAGGLVYVLVGFWALVVPQLSLLALHMRLRSVAR